MAAFKLLDFKDIYDAVIEEMKIQSSDTNSINRIKRDINMIYLDEVIPYSRWPWLHGNISVKARGYYGVGSASVTTDSKTVTLSTAPASGEGSFAGFRFSIDGQEEIYTIKSHTAASTTVVLDHACINTTNATASYKIWRDQLPLPVDLREVVEVRHERSKSPLEPKGLQEFRRLSARGPKGEGRPFWYYIGDYVDPEQYTTPSGMATSVSRSSSQYIKTLVFDADISSLLPVGTSIEVSSSGDDTYDGEYVVRSLATTTVANDTITYVSTDPLTEANTADTGITVKTETAAEDNERYRNISFYPGINADPTMVHIDYVREATALESDGDEPVMAIEDRIVLLYGALSRAWARERNTSEAARNFELFNNKLGRMASKIEDTLDKPQLTPNSEYVSMKRGPRLNRLNRRSVGSGGGSTYQIPTYLEGVTINGATLTGNMTASAGITIDGRDISADGTSLDAHIAATSGVHGATGSVVGTTDAQILTNKSIDSDNNTITNIVDADIKAAAAIARTKLASGTADVVLINNGSGVMTEEARLALSRFKDGTVSLPLIGQGAGSDSIYGQIVDASVDAAAAIALTKLATVTASRALESDGSGNIVASVITADELDYLDDVEKLTSATLTDNTSNGTVATWAHASFEALILEYSVKRSSAREVGHIYITHDSSTVSVSDVGTSMGTSGVTFDGVISGSDVVLRYTTTSTGNNADMKYKLHKWLM